MPTLSLNDVERDVYESIGVLELHGPSRVWKAIWVGDLQVLFHPGEWRFPPRLVDELDQGEPAPPAPERRTIRI